MFSFIFLFFLIFLVPIVIIVLMIVFVPKLIKSSIDRHNKVNKIIDNLVDITDKSAKK